MTTGMTTDVRRIFYGCRSSRVRNGETMIGSSVGVETDLQPGDRVAHVRDANLAGTVISVEANRLSVIVRWDGTQADDFQWANKMERL